MATIHVSTHTMVDAIMANDGIRPLVNALSAHLYHLGHAQREQGDDPIAWKAKQHLDHAAALSNVDGYAPHPAFRDVDKTLVADHRAA